MDYIVAIVLPYLLASPLDDDDRTNNLTKEESKNLSLNGIPVRIEHSQDDVDVVGKLIGQVMTTGAKRVLLQIPAQGSVRARYASKMVAARDFKCVSLGHQVDGGFYEGEEIMHKFPLEISLCREGWRNGSDIIEYFPSLYTLQKLTDSERQTAAIAFKYSEELNRRVPPGTKPSDSQYISAFAQIVKERLVQTINKFDHQVKNTNGILLISSKVIMASATQDSPVTDTSSVQQDQTMASGDAIATDPAPTSSSSSAQAMEGVSSSTQAAVSDTSSSSSAQGQDASMQVDESVQQQQQQQRQVPKVSAVDLNDREQLVSGWEAERKARADLEAKYVRMQEDLENHRKKVKVFEDEKAEKSRKARQELIDENERLFNSYKDAAEDADISHEEVQAAATAYQEMKDKNPEIWQTAWKPIVSRTVNASKSNQKRREESVRFQKQQEAKREDDQIESLANRINALAGRPYKASSSSFTDTNLFVDRNPASSSSSSATPAQATEPAVSDPMKSTSIVDAVNCSMQQQQLTNDKLVPNVPMTSSLTVNASKNAGPFASSSSALASTNSSKAWARDDFINQMKTFGTIPSYLDVARGHAFVPTGRMEASRDGQQVPGKREVYKFEEPREFGVNEFDPDTAEHMREYIRNKPRSHVLKGPRDGDGWAIREVSY